MPRPNVYVYLVITPENGVEGAFANFASADARYTQRYPFMTQYEWSEHPERPGRWTKPRDFHHRQIMIQRELIV